MSTIAIIIIGVHALHASAQLQPNTDNSNDCIVHIIENQSATTLEWSVVNQGSAKCGERQGAIIPTRSHALGLERASIIRIVPLGAGNLMEAKNQMEFSSNHPDKIICRSAEARDGLEQQQHGKPPTVCKLRELQPLHASCVYVIISNKSIYDIEWHAESANRGPIEGPCGAYTEGPYHFGPHKFRVIQAKLGSQIVLRSRDWAAGELRFTIHKTAKIVCKGNGHDDKGSCYFGTETPTPGQAAGPQTHQQTNFQLYATNNMPNHVAHAAAPMHQHQVNQVAG